MADDVSSTPTLHETCLSLTSRLQEQLKITCNHTCSTCHTHMCTSHVHFALNLSILCSRYDHACDANVKIYLAHVRSCGITDASHRRNATMPALYVSEYNKYLKSVTTMTLQYMR